MGNKTAGKQTAGNRRGSQRDNRKLVEVGTEGRPTAEVKEPRDASNQGNIDGHVRDSEEGETSGGGKKSMGGGENFPLTLILEELREMKGLMEKNKDEIKFEIDVLRESIIEGEKKWEGEKIKIYGYFESMEERIRKLEEMEMKEKGKSGGGESGEKKWAREREEMRQQKNMEAEIKKMKQNQAKWENEETVRQNSMNIENLNEVNFPIEGQSEKPHIYSFDHGNHTFYKTTDESPVLSTDRFVEKTHQAATRFWAEIFSTIHIGITFVTAFILQLFKFILCSVVRPLTVGVIQLTADYFIKPVLMITFNGLIQPVLIFLYNIATSFRDVCKPIAEALGYFLSEVAGLCRAIRLVEIHK
ncbi:uncharacterized protein LOC130665703 isoform X1 [Microplitis mediator]|uniref:uncharacterized protein LOC130665703 isoform X1 n=1 Tax=Microplitis mediator TaxID=375433 RepID=UPI002552AFD3|nr:uncharacterized protein LOC130665703 isoform X1 [Microplitis mediator]